MQAEWRRESDWLDALPRLAAECAQRWDLVLEAPFDTPHSLVVPAGDVVLKLNAPCHYEADYEAEALARWAGRGAVRIVARDDARRALLIERCVPGTRLADSPGDEPAVVAELLPALAIEATEPHPFRTVADEAARWEDEVRTRYDLSGRAFERSLLDVAVEVFRGADRYATLLVNQDLHGGNFLRAEREPWLVIDPKPLVGELEVNGVGLLRNAAASRGTAAVRRCLNGLRDVGLDRERTRAWAIAHALAWGWKDGRWAERSLDVARAIAAA